MKPQIVDLDLDSLHRMPKSCFSSVFWELDEDEGADLDPFFHKEEWFSSTLLEWGPCGKLLLDAEECLGFTQYAPATLFPRLRRFRTGRVSADAPYLSYCFVVEGRRARRHGEQLVRAVARDCVERGYHGLEAIGDRHFDGGWVLPEAFLARCGFKVIREDERYPLMRLELRNAEPVAVASERASVPAPMLALDGV
jgi:GNAT superfamily N-acetyltransferase